MAKNLQRNTQSTLPLDVIEIILIRLPVKSLLRFKSVSKSWSTMISNSRFVRIHHQLSINSDSPNLLLFAYSSHKGFSFVRLKGRKFQTEAVLGRTRKGVFCVADGMVVFWNGSTFLLWNPCTEQEMITSHFPYRLSGRFVFGICYDRINNDFKVVFGSYDENVYAVFSCKNRSWTMEKPLSYPCKFRGISADGAIYWILRDHGYDLFRRRTEPTHNLLLCFDPRDDNFKILQKPENVKDNKYFDLSCLKGCLCLYCRNGEDETRFQVWIKEKGGPDRDSWMVLMYIEDLPKPVCSLMRLLTFVENKIVLEIYGSNCPGARFLVYDPDEKTYEEIEDSEFRGCSGFIGPFLGTMFFPIMERIG